MTAAVDRIRNLAVDVRWAKPRRLLWLAEPVVPLVGPLAGRRTVAEAQADPVRVRWKCFLTISPHPNSWEATVPISIVQGGGAWTWPDAAQARDALTKLLHGDTEGLRWHRYGSHSPTFRPISELAGWLDGLASPTGGRGR